MSSLSFGSEFSVKSLNWIDVSNDIKKIIPPLTHSSHKGSMGRIGVLGGSATYTGAPYYAGVSALKFGADISFVFCAQQASIPIKSYSPELIVIPFYDEMNDYTCDKHHSSIIVGHFERMHTLVIGPGLDRKSIVKSITSVVIESAIKSNLP